jgi:SAM-dependent MidA family methyltransferase
MQTEVMNARDAESGAEPLIERLRARIRRAGAISFHDWMAAALYDKRGGYYFRRDLKRWGRAGDYRTAPERSPLFAATFAEYFAKLYEELSAPHEWTIFEAGSGAGDFAWGVLQTLRRDHPQVFSATRYVIDEASEDARERAANKLAEFAGRVEFLRLADASEMVSEGIVFSNELLDAFPVHRVTVRNNQLRELFVDLDEAGRFTWAEREPSTPLLAEHLARSGVELSAGQIAEINLEIEGWMRRATSASKRGYLLIVDYGAEAPELYSAPHRHKGTLRAFQRHGFAEDVLSRPGEQDLTTTIDWTHVLRIGTELGLQTVCFKRQDEFLLEAGLLDKLERMRVLAETETDALVLASGVRDLILPGGMSESFQVLVQKK